MLPGLNPPLTPGAGSSLGLGQVPMSVQMPVDAYLDNHTADILEKGAREGRLDRPAKAGRGVDRQLAAVGADLGQPPWLGRCADALDLR